MQAVIPSKCDGFAFDPSALGQLEFHQGQIQSGTWKGGTMSQLGNEEWVYTELRRRAVAMFGEERAAHLEDYLRTTAKQVVDVENATVHRDLEPVVQD